MFIMFTATTEFTTNIGRKYTFSTLSNIDSKEVKLHLTQYF